MYEVILWPVQALSKLQSNGSGYFAIGGVLP